MRRVGTGFLAVAGLGGALLLPAVGGSQAAKPKVPKPKFYDVRITTELDTKWLNGGCEPYCGNGYEGTFSSSQTFKSVRISFKKQYGGTYVSFRSPFNARGTGSGQYDHRSTYCKRDRISVSGQAMLSLTGQYPLPTPDPLPRLSLADNFIGRYVETCFPEIQRVPVAARVSGSLVAGSLSNAGIGLEFLVGMPTSGPGFPVDRLMRGKGFAIALKGKSIVRQEDFKTQKYANVTTGSARIVFTPSGRAAAGSRGPQTAGATTCAKTYPEYWSTKRRTCFLVSASAAWRHTTTWTKDNEGQPCKGSDARTMSWTSPPTTFWVGDTFPTGYTGSGARTHNVFSGLVKAKLSRRVSGGAREYGCVPMLRKDCGARTATFRDTSTSFTNIDGSFAYLPGTLTTVSPFRACGLVAGEGAFTLAPTWAGFVPFPVPAANDEDIAKRLSALRVGGSLVLRGTGGPPPYAPETGLPRETGSFTGKLVFKRVK